MRGGRPPRERRIRGESVVRTGAFVQDVARALIVVALFSLKVRKAAAVIIKYVSSVRRVRLGENCKIRIIQPR